MKTGDKYNPYMTFQGCIVPNCIMERTDLTTSAKLCFGRLAQYAGKNGLCFPSLKQLSEGLGVSEATAERAIKDLISANLIEKKSPAGVQKLMHIHNTYTFVWSDSFLESPSDEVSEPSKLGCGFPQNEGNKKENHEKENHNKKQIQPSADFVLFWKLYPERKDKAKSEIAFNKIKNRPSIDIILEAVRKQIEWRETANGDFRAKWKYPTTWLNGRCWEDEISCTEEPKQAWEK